MNDVTKQTLIKAGYNQPQTCSADRVVIELYKRPSDNKKVYIIAGELYERTDIIEAIVEPNERVPHRAAPKDIPLIDRQFGTGQSEDSVELIVRPDCIEINKHDKNCRLIGQVSIELWDGAMRANINPQSDTEFSSIDVCYYKPIGGHDED